MHHYEISFVFASGANKNLFSIKSTNPRQNLEVSLRADLQIFRRQKSNTWDLFPSNFEYKSSNSFFTSALTLKLFLPTITCFPRTRCFAVVVTRRFAQICFYDSGGPNTFPPFSVNKTSFFCLSHLKISSQSCCL